MSYDKTIPFTNLVILFLAESLRYNRVLIIAIISRIITLVIAASIAIIDGYTGSSPPAFTLMLFIMSDAILGSIVSVAFTGSTSIDQYRLFGRWLTILEFSRIIASGVTLPLTFMLTFHWAAIVGIYAGINLVTFPAVATVFNFAWIVYHRRRNANIEPETYLTYEDL